MSLGRTHEAALFVAVTAALVLVLAGGALPDLAWLVVLVPPLSLVLKSRGLAAPAVSGTAIGLASIGMGVAEIVTRGVEAAVLGGGVLLVGLVTARVLTRETLAHDLQCLLLALLLVLAGSALNLGPSFIALFFVFAIAAVIALATRQLLAGALGDESLGSPRAARVRARTDVVTPLFLVYLSGVACSVLAATAVIFALFPRIGFTNFGLSSSRTGQFPSAVSLSGLPRGAVGSDAVIARVFGVSREHFMRGLYLRGGVYDVVDERGFAQSPNPPTYTRRGISLARAPDEIRYEIVVAPVAGELLFTLGDPTVARPLSGGLANPSARLAIQGLNPRGELIALRPLASPLRYEVRGGVAAAGFVPREATHLAVDDFAHYLALPDGLDPRVVNLARELVGDATDPVAQSVRLRTALLRDFTYTLDQPSGGAEYPLRSFLFETKAGHCEYFASAYALLLRAIGIPSRVVGGYQGGLLDEDEGYVLFLARNAHAWVEWYHPTRGWIVDDATPAAGSSGSALAGLDRVVESWRRFWDDRIVDYSLNDQMASLRSARSFFSELDTDRLGGAVLRVGLVVAAGGGLLVLARRLRRRRSLDVSGLASHLLGAVARVDGRPVPETATLREAVAQANVDEEGRRVLRGALLAYEGARFGGRALPDAVLRTHVAALGALRAPAPAAEARRGA